MGNQTDDSYEGILSSISKDTKRLKEVSQEVTLRGLLQVSGKTEEHLADIKRYWVKENDSRREVYARDRQRDKIEDQKEDAQELKWRNVDDRKRKKYVKELSESFGEGQSKMSQIFDKIEVGLRNLASAELMSRVTGDVQYMISDQIESIKSIRKVLGMTAEEWKGYNGSCY